VNDVAGTSVAQFKISLPPSRASFPREAAPSTFVMKQLNVLLVVYAFPPAGGVGVLRAASLARYLPAQGIRLDVLTTRNPSSVGTDMSLLAEIPPEVTIHRTVTLDLPFGVKKRLKKFVTHGKAPAGKSDRASGSHKPGLLKWLLQDLLLPDPQVTWFPFMRRAARRIVRRRSIDLVLITAAPFSNLLVAEKLRREFPRLPIVLDFRDEWLATCFDASTFQFSRSDRAYRYAVKAEAAAVRSATAVVSVTEPSNREIRSRYPEESDRKFQYFPNGFDATRMPQVASADSGTADSKIVVTHIGSIYAINEPTNFVEGMLALPADIRSRFKLRFIGHIEEGSYRSTLERLGSIVEFKGYMPQGEALAAIRDTDYVLLIKHGRLNIVAKFYDYLGGGKPILAALHPEAPEGAMIDELRAGWWADIRDVNAVRQLLLDAAARGKAPFSDFRPDTEKIAQFERKAVAGRYAAFLHSIARATGEKRVEEREPQTSGRTS
jgi:glycosyltransferase involved in cell wall biosynthesis